MIDRLKYDIISYRLFGSRSRNKKSAYTELENALKKANIFVPVEVYIARATLTSLIVGLAAAVLGAIFAFLLSSMLSSMVIGVFSFLRSRGISSPIALSDLLAAFSSSYPLMVLTIMTGGSPMMAPLVALLIFVIAYFLCRWAFNYYPEHRASSRRREIDAMYPHAITFLYAQSHGGVNPLDAFRSLSEHKEVYGEMSMEAEAIVKGVDMLGIDLITSTKEVSSTTPSELLRTFLESMVSVMESGGDLSKFLHDKIEQYREVSMRQQKGSLDLLGMMAEVYVTAMVAGPLFIIIIMVSIGMMNPSNITIIRLIVYLLMPIGSFLFIVMLYSMGLVESSYSLSTTERALDAFGDVKVVPDEKGRTVVISGWRIKLRKLYDDMWVMIMNKPELAFFLSVPAAALVGALLLFSNNTLFGFIRGIEGIAVLCFLIAVGPYASLWEAKKFKINKTDTQIPEFLKRLASINESGLTIDKAIKTLMYSNLGVLNIEVKRIVKDLEWGAGVKEALIRFEHRVNTLSIRRSITLTIRASDSSTNIKDTLQIAASDAQANIAMRDQRSTDMLVYVSIIYISFLVFLYVAFVLVTTFLPTMSAAGSGVPDNLASMGFFTKSSMMQAASMKTLLYHAVLIQGLCSGIVAGVMGDGNPSAGLKHSIIMILVTYIAFVLFL